MTLLLQKTLLGLFAAGIIASPAAAQNFRLSSSSVAEGAQLAPAQVFKGFGCDGGNTSPQLAWADAPEGTKSFAVTAYDPDAPTGSGWWHWNIVNIPAAASQLPSGASGTDKLPAGSVELRNDYGTAGFGGACPPPGEMHRYVFTVHALGVQTLDLPPDASNALAGFMIGANTIGKASVTAVYNR
ncbi:YbhB/YbcL family Raf kinase inhibitor-like protein [Paracoccus shanxieyensis]|uniref:YbhB/YbcL family Raf kinase inhibitor-like protein n=1 Tax=Paracoccus shanxieyensis TaxID=2675752 RepID=A0A6L6IXZ2_9RHOB|nr:YbhB/YbcL family Raf kinase inhibitor-like protein [Paracoccus shanxieyensis]MTH63930.1 YbhB/YbcL family Raf kinase inhibitor-like protein [Paracoccus shanxieyensis]MTH87029.1 YbhB/YbcL family Raf kinase inhibitor-like protein [Paracoccus shanxieyensis]